jgi:hypothetical protein
MTLNTLYGYFGRSRELLHTKFINKEQLKDILRICIIDSLIEINDNSFIVVIKNNISQNLIKKLNLQLD